MIPALYPDLKVDFQLFGDCGSIIWIRNHQKAEKLKTLIPYWDPLKSGIVTPPALARLPRKLQLPLDPDLPRDV